MGVAGCCKTSSNAATVRTFIAKAPFGVFSRVSRTRLLSAGAISEHALKVQELWTHPYYLDSRLDMPEQYRAIGWVSGRLYSIIFEIREDNDGEYYHLITLWKATKEEQKLYEEHFQS